MGAPRKCIRVLVFAAAIWSAPTAASAIETSVQMAPEMIAARAESGVDGAAASRSSTALPTAVERAASPNAGGGASPAASSTDAASGSRAAAAGDAGIGHVSPTASATSSAAEQVARLEFAARVVGADGSDRDLVLDGPNDGIATDAPFEIEIQRFRGSDVRVRLFDESHRQVPSTDRLESSGIRTRYRLKPQEPLDSGSRYVLTIEGLRTDLPTDSAGRRYRQERIELKTAGEPPPVTRKSPPRQKQPTRKRQRR